MFSDGEELFCLAVDVARLLWWGGASGHARGYAEYEMWPGKGGHAQPMACMKVCSAVDVARSLGCSGGEEVHGMHDGASAGTAARQYEQEHIMESYIQHAPTPGCVGEKEPITWDGVASAGTVDRSHVCGKSYRPSVVQPGCSAPAV